MDFGPHVNEISAGNAGERTIRFALVLNKRPVSGVNTTTLLGYLRLGFMERDGTKSNAAPTNTPVEEDATNLPGIYALELTEAEADHGEVLLHIDDGDGSTFDFGYVLHRFYGGDAGLMHR